jgi:hypothetical protein
MSIIQKIGISGRLEIRYNFFEKAKCNLRDRID